MKPGTTTPTWTFSTSLSGYGLTLGAGHCWLMVRSAGPLEMALTEIEKAIAAGLIYIAVVMTLTLPDICAALEDENAYSGRDEYKKWYSDNLAYLFPSMSAADCYSLRCGVVHKGNLGLKSKGSQFSRVIFTVPNAQRNVWHNCVMNDALQFDAVMFCNDVISAVRSWYNVAKSNPTVVANLPNIIQLRPNGIAPYMVGIPLIA